MTGKGWGLLCCALAFVACAAGHGRYAQDTNAASNPNATQVPGISEAPTAMDPAVRSGKLGNGLTYYVLEHRKPEHRAALWLAVDAGAFLEDDDQLGLAHFVEHMAFNGTKHFPRLAIADFMEHAGMVFGPDLNATTTVDETLYQLTVPTDTTEVLLKGLDFLRDVAGDVSFDSSAVERERAVLLEEWRMRRGAAARVRERELPVLLRGSRYATRTTMLPGLVESATPAALRRFYKDWYRPDSMAVIAVGDFDGAGIEREIKARFADVAEPAKPRPHIPVWESLKQEPLVSIQSDPEQQRTILSTFEKVEHLRRHSQGDFRREWVERLYLSIMSERWAELRDDPDSPWVDAKIGRQRLNRALDAFSNVITCREGRFDDSVGLLFRELTRVARFGFLPAELERASRRALTDAERMMLESPNSPLTPLASEIVRNFLEHEEMPGSALQLAWTRQIVPTISLGEVNAFARKRAAAASRVTMIHAPTNVGLPTTEQLQALVAQATKAPLSPWTEAGPKGPLLSTPPLPGPVVKTEHDSEADATVWTLENGIRVVVKPTRFRQDSVVVTGWQPGGTSLVSDSDFVHARFAQDIILDGGAGNFSPRALNHLLAGKKVSVRLTLGESDEWVSASARPEDLETMFQLLHLELLRPNRSEAGFESWKTKAIEAVRHRAESPELRFLDEVSRTQTGDALRARPTTTEMIEQVDLNRAYALWKERFTDFGAYTFLVVGNVDPALLKPWAETYLGSLPSKPPHEHRLASKVSYPTGVVERTVSFGQEPKSLVWLSSSAPMTWSREAQRDAQVLEWLLRIRLREVLRDDLGGVYNVNVSVHLFRGHDTRHRLDVSFACAPANVDKLKQALFDELATLAANGVGEDYLTKVREQLRRRHEVDLHDNAWWAASLRDAYYYGDGFAEIADLDALLERVTSFRVRETAQRMFDPKSYVLVALRPNAGSAPN